MGRVQMRDTVISLTLVCFLITFSTAGAQPLRVDFSRPDGRVEEGFEGYFAGQEQPATFTPQSYEAFGTTVTITPTWAADAVAAAMQSFLRPDPHWTTIDRADLLVDWIGTDTRQSGDPLTLTISGLPAGTYNWRSYHHDVGHNPDRQYQTGLFDVTVNDATGSTTTTGIDISCTATVVEGIDRFADVTKFTTQIVSGGSDITFVFHQQVNDPVPEAFFAMNGFELSYPPAMARSPLPANQASDIPLDTVLTWTPGEYAPAVDGHKVYLSDSLEEVGEGLAAAERGVVSDPAFDTAMLPFPLEYGSTYYWRVDEANVPSGAWDEGSIWSFTVEPLGYPLPGQNITVTASSSNTADEGPGNTVNGSGLTADDLHSDESKAMWLSSVAGPQPTWIQYEFERVYRLRGMSVWNHNTTNEPVIGYGIKEAVITYSADGVAWTTLGATHELARGPGAAGYAANTTIDFAGLAAKYVRITANSNWGGLVDQYGLSEVRFLYVPVAAREPSPSNGATDVHPEVTLGWRAGREAAAHDLYLSTEEQAVADGNVLPVTIAESSYSTPLDLSTTYYWRIDEVNEAETPAIWPGDVWSLSTREYLVVDDFESYTDDTDADEAIFQSWLDGYEDATNGSLVGYESSSDGTFGERTIVHGSMQSMPLFYSNTDAALSSETTRTFAEPQNWAKYGIQTLGLWFHGLGGNTGQLYLKINGVRIPYDQKAANLAIPAWQPWNVDLTTAGVDLENVTSLTIGIDGNGAVGTLYLDDIRLYAQDRQLITPTDPGAASLVAQYQFEGSGDDSVGTNHGTITGEPEYVTGKDGQALHFKGINNAVQIPPFDYTNDQGEFSTTFWFKVKGLEGTARNNNFPFMLCLGSAAEERVLVHWRTETLELRTQIQLTNPDESGSPPPLWQYDIPGAGLLDGEWHMHAVTSSAVDGCTVYIDGKAADTNPECKGSMTNLDEPIYLGSRWDDTRFFGDLDPDSGLLDDVRFYGTVLSPAEVAWLAGWTAPFDEPF